MLKYICLGLLVLIVGAWVYVRFNPLGSELHIDPQDAPIPPVPGHILVRADGAIQSPRFEISARQLASQLERIILATPRTQKLAGNIQSDFATYVTKSGLWGFPDIANVKVIATGDSQSAIIILSRLRYGKMDFGVNRKRVENWLAQLDG